MKDIADRRAVNAIKRYLRKNRYAFTEYDHVDMAKHDTSSVFAVGWSGNVVSYLRVSQSSANIPSDIYSLLYALKHLKDVTVIPGGHEVLWLEKLVGIESLEILEWNQESLPESWACESTLAHVSFSTDCGYLPTAIRHFSNLRSLSLNELNRVPLILPDWLSNFSQLERLDLRKCYIKSIPYSLIKTGLPFVIDKYAEHGILLEGVTLQEGDITLFAQSQEVIEAYYQGQAQTADTFRECKVIFLGDVASGKSSLIDRIVNGRFCEGSLPTNGMKVYKWVSEFNGKPFTLRFVDFGGQEIMHVMHRCFLTSHTVYVVVCESRDDAEIDFTAARWLETIRTFAPDCPVILALNKADLNPHITVNERELHRRNSELREVLRTSACVQQDNLYGVSRLIDAILEQATNCAVRVIGNPGFLSIKETLENMTEDYITAAQYQRLCEAHGIANSKLQRSLLNWLRDLGVVYFYDPDTLDTLVSRVRILNPVWLTNGIYRLLLRIPDMGFLPHSQIMSTLNDISSYDILGVTYTPEEVEYILHVMRMFELSHDIGNGEELIPMKLPKYPPDSIEAFDRANSLHLRWEGTYLPNNLIHRLMIREFDNIDRHCLWRTGAHFSTEKFEALAEMNDRTLDLYVWSNHDSRVYMQMFRDQILEIAHSLNLELREMICVSKNGRNGTISYAVVLRQYRDGRSDIYVEGLDEFISPADLLKENYVTWGSEAERSRYVSAEPTEKMEAAQECKVIFLGDGGSGKSSLIDRIINDHFEKDSLPTEGVKFHKWFTKLAGKPFTLRFLDFGGQEIMHAMHRCFLTSHTVYVIVCESRDDTEIDSVAARWLETVKSFASDCPVVLALNKADLNPNVSVNEANLRTRSEQLAEVLRTSAAVARTDEKYGTSRLISAIWEQIPKCVSKITTNADMLGLKWDLENMEEDYITAEQYQRLCEKHHITDSKTQRSMLNWFKELGVAYFYETKAHDTLLTDVRVLNPLWLTNGIYRLILRTSDTGFLPHSEIKETLKATNKKDICPDKVYKPKETDYILHVMRMFEISHKMESGMEMIPMKLNKTPPKTLKNFDRVGTLHLRWEGNYLPNNLIHRLMIRKFGNPDSGLDTECVWRTGARFHQGHSEALAEMDEDALDLYVRGEHDSLEYMASFRTEIQSILSALNLSVTEVICYTIEGKERSIPYDEVMLQYSDGRDEIHIPGTHSYIAPDELLRRTYFDWKAETKHWQDNVERNESRDTSHSRQLQPEQKGLGETVNNWMEAFKNFAEGLGALGKAILFLVLVLAILGVVSISQPVLEALQNLIGS